MSERTDPVNAGTLAPVACVGVTSDDTFDVASLIDMPFAAAAEPDSTADFADSARYYERISYLVPDLPALESISPDGKRFVSVRDGEIVLRGAGGDSVQQLTFDIAVDNGWEVDGQGVDPWAPDQRHLFALHFDRSDVLKIPRVHFHGDRQSIDWPQQPKAGAPIGHARPHIVAVDGAAPVELKLGETRDRYFRLFGWAADGQRIWLGRYVRDMSCVDVFAADPSTGVAQLCLSETSTTFLTDVSEVIWGGWTGFTLLTDGGFLWRSERDGWSRLYRYDAEGVLVGPITPTRAVVHGVVRLDNTQNVAYVTASMDGDRPYDVHLYRAALGGSRMERLTEGNGVHEVRFELDGKHFIDTWSSPSAPTRVERRHVDGRLESLLGEAGINRLLASGWRPPETLVVRAADGVTELHGLLLFPREFDAMRQYPLIEMVYGGPQMVVSPKRFVPISGGVEPLLHRLAREGFFVWVLDARGTPGRGKAFRDAVYRDFADHVVADHAEALKQLFGSRPFIDPDRVGVFGRSWGGYFALRFLIDEPDLYRAGISVVPGFDVYGGMLYEPYLGLPQIDGAAYRAADLYALATCLTRPFLMMSGTLDTSTLGDAYRMSMTLTKAGIAHQNVVFPEQDHAFTGAAAAQHDREVRDFFQRELRS